MARSRKRAVIAIVLALLGGAAIIIGALLTWIDVGQGVSVGTRSVTGTPKGTEFLLGQVALGAGIAAVVFALLLLVAPRAGRVWGALLLVSAVAAIAPSVYAYSQPQKEYVDYAITQGAPKGSSTSDIETSLNRLFEISNLEAKPGLGAYAAFGGGVAVALAGLFALFQRRRSSTRSVDRDEAQPAVMSPLADQPKAPGEARELPRVSDPQEGRPSDSPMG
jgi:hypothetical protein